MPSEVFGYTGAAQSFVVPAGVTNLDVELVGASGGDGDILITGGVMAQGAHNGNAGQTADGTAAVQIAYNANRIKDGDLALMWLVSAWDVADSPTTVSVAGWTHVVSTPVASGATRSVRGQLWSKLLGPGEASGTVTVVTSSGGTRRSIAAIRRFAPFHGTTPTISGVTTDAAASSGLWTPNASPVDSGRHMRFGFWAADTGLTAEHWGQTMTGSSGTSVVAASGTYFLARDAGSVAGDSPTLDLGLAAAAVSCMFNVSADLPPAYRWPKGGKGGMVRAIVPVAPGDTVTITVPGAGITSSPTGGGAAVWPSDATAQRGGGTGGGRAEVSVNGVPKVTAGGGGGAGGFVGWSDLDVPHGGDGGFDPSDGFGFTGAYVNYGPGVRGQSQPVTGNGTRGMNSSGAAGNEDGGRGNPANGYEAGGGGGAGQGRDGLSPAFVRYGGGGGGGSIDVNVTVRQRQGGGAGGGRSYLAGDCTLINDESGHHIGDGYVIIRWEALRTGWFLGTHMGGSGWAVT